jgi:hypothetical protein
MHTASNAAATRVMIPFLDTIAVEQQFSLRLESSSWDSATMLPHHPETGGYYYRRRMPWRSKGELTLSLRTRSFREAQWLAAWSGSAIVHYLRDTEGGYSHPRQH